ncbi:MAG: anhydro-N-acetylmuramic acid kinase [Pseudomonadota bacterium]
MKIDEPIWALGAMSGTSLDGVDAAMLRTDGETIAEFGDTAFRPYTAEEQSTLRAALGQWPDGPDVAAAQEVVETAHAALLSRFRAEIVGFHGQTLAHDPYGLQGAPRTHQTGDGAVLAEILQMPVVWDFRTADVELGGQGAPLAPFFHFACAKYIGATQPVAFLNLGGVGNLTCVDPDHTNPDDPGALLAFDTGPANAPVNDLMTKRRNQPFDENGDCAARGQPDMDIVQTFLTDPYFLKIPPKSLDRNDFPRLSDMVTDLSDEDAAATLTRCISASVAQGLEHAPAMPREIYVTGGGRKNAYLMKCLADDIEAEITDINETGLNGDMLEAQAFAYLATRVARGLPTSCPSTTGVAGAVGGGRLNRPTRA